MASTKSPLPIFRADRFELSGKKEDFERLIPLHHNRLPREEERDPALWAVEGVLAPGRSERVLLAANIDDVEIPHPTEEGKTMTITGENIAAMFVSSRMGRLAAEFPHVDILSGNEARMVLPRAAVAPIYAEGMGVAAESVFPVAAPAGKVAAGANVGIDPVPESLPQAA